MPSGPQRLYHQPIGVVIGQGDAGYRLATSAGGAVPNVSEAQGAGREATDTSEGFTFRPDLGNVACMRVAHRLSGLSPHFSEVTAPVRQGLGFLAVVFVDDL